MFEFHIGPFVETVIDWLTLHLDPFFSAVNSAIEWVIEGLEYLLMLLPSYVLIAAIALVAWRLAGKGLAIFAALGLVLIDAMQLWPLTMSTLALVLTSALIALLFGIPLGIWASRNNSINRIMRPVLDFMQTMPAFVYLIPAVLFFGMGQVPGAVATVIFAMPPVVRLTNLGIRQVPEDVIEASKSFGSTDWQMLKKVQLPLAMSTILAGVNQTIMLALSMVVISSMIGAGGLGEQVLKGITQMQIGKGFEGGLAVVILAMLLDRITQALGLKKRSK